MVKVTVLAELGVPTCMSPNGSGAVEVLLSPEAACAGVSMGNTNDISTAPSVLVVQEINLFVSMMLPFSDIAQKI